ncbi:ABC transporter permease [Pseudocolwellia agarivorans]|uniref:ABC transporter permease n=1 Tax=Pseudocolwellia agarivorans TaxID=1911682 RepID=UPI003F8831C1
MFFRLASKSIIYRKGSVVLTIIALSISMLVMFGVEHIREQAKVSFSNSVSGVDIIVGTRTGELNLLLYSVFRMGKPTNNMSWQSYSNLKNNPQVKWALPISLGDSHRGYRVLGTTSNYFDYFSYSEKQALEFSNGNKFNHLFDVVIGSEVSKSLKYQLGDQLTLAHGIGSTSFTSHTDTPFKIVGVLKPTGTAVDQTLHISLQGLEAIHLSASKRKELLNKAQQPLTNFVELQPQSVTAVMLGLKSRLSAFQLQRNINTNNEEPLMALLPGVALSELWQTLSVAESTLRLISSLVIISTLFGLSAMLLASIRERQQEIKLLRMIGASPFFIYWLIELEALLITLVSAFIAIVLLTVGLTASKSFLLTHYGLSVNANILSVNTLITISILLFLTFLAAIPPAFMAFKEANRR